MEPFFKRLPQAVPFKPAPSVLYAFDFDGTLSKLVRQPGRASLSPRTRVLLEELARSSPVVIITGRSVGDLQKRLGMELPYLVGNHGLEGFLGTKSALLRAERNSRAWKRALEAEPLDPGVEIEDKRFSLAVHYRHARNRDLTRIRLERIVQGLVPAPRVVGGKCVLNLVQPDAPHKGTALLKLMKRLKAKRAVYVGDDDTDEDVFRLRQKQLLTIRVGRKDESGAKYYIERQSDINKLIRALLDGAGGRETLKKRARPARKATSRPKFNGSD